MTRPVRAIVALIASIGMSLAAVAARAESGADRWNLGDLYANAAAWDADVARLESQLGELAACRGHLGDSSPRFSACLDLRADAAKRFYRLSLFAGEKHAEDTGDAPSLTLEQRAELIGHRLEEAEAFFEPEILRLGADRVALFVAQEPALRIHRFPLDRILRAAPHTLDEAGEALVAKFALMGGVGASAYGVLSDADMPWPKVKLAGGAEIVLDQSAYTKYRESADRADRKRVMDAFFATWKGFERTSGVLLSAQLKQDTAYSRVRRYPDSISRALDRQRIPVAVVDTLIAQTNANLPTLHRYFRLRARMLGVGDMRYFDIYPPLVHGDYRFALDEARQLVLETAAPLGADYVAALGSGLQSRWMDAYPRPKKQSGAHMAGYAYDVHPYVLMNYNDDYESVTILAHEWGHAMHSVLANRGQPFVTANYATFIAEIASTLNEELLLDRMLKAAKTDDERLYYLGESLEGLRGTFFRQAMFAEFERDIHARSDRGEPLTGDAFTKSYCELLKRHHGAPQGVVAIDDAYCIEWAYIPHFYTSFYVYQYATSIAASALFAERIVGGDKAALGRYLDMLKAGGSDYPYELVKTAGVDLATPAPYQALVARMNRIMDDIEAILAKRRPGQAPS
ncbi:MAG TPA: M3 family oligoendopeptidase [Caldimonas sp.]